MKTAVLFKAALAVVASAFVLSSCAKQEEEVPVNPAEPAGYRFILGDVSTRAVLASGEHGRYGQWESSDQLGSVASNGSETRCGYNYVNINGSEASFILYWNGGFQGGEKVRVYFPYSASTKSLSAVSFKIPASQSQEGTTFDFDAMPMVSNEYEIPGPSTGTNPNNYPTAEINLANLASVAEFRIYTSNSAYKGERIESVRFDADKPLAGPFTKDISGVNIYDPSTLTISGYEATSVTTSVSSGQAIKASASSAISVYMVVAPGSYGGTVTVTTDKAIYKYPLKSAQSFKRSVVRYMKVDLGSCTDRTLKGADAPVTVAKTISQILDEMGQGSATGGTVVNPLIVDEYITMKTTGTGNNGKVYQTAPNQNWRLYTSGNGNVIITAAAGYELVELMFDYAALTDELTFTGPSSGVAISVSGSEVEYKLTKGNMRINAVSVTYQKSSGVSGPVLVTGSASDITTSEATLTASYSGVDLSHAPQSAAFRWGTSKSSLTEIEYSTDLIDSVSGAYSVMLASLEENTTYWYQAVMEVWDPEAGKYVDLEGEIKSFKTGQAYAMAPGYLSCYEVPDVTVSTGGTGLEKYGNSSYYYYNTSNSKRRVVVHTFHTPSGEKVRNYTVFFDGTKYAPTWTAHAMHGDVWGDSDVGRSGTWTFDPGVPNSWQQKGLKNANTVGYDRGHFVASNYRQLSEEDNGQTFYYTNQAPQNSSFNGGVWGKMEQDIAAKAKTLHSSDTLYVVVGVLYEYEGSVPTLPSSDKQSVNVPIPSHFYCCTMLCSFDDYGEMTDARGGAYIFTNEAHSGAHYYDNAFKATIDDIEDRAGFNFFPRVPLTLQSDAESVFSKVI